MSVASYMELFAQLPPYTELLAQLRTARLRGDDLEELEGLMDKLDEVWGRLSEKEQAQIEEQLRQLPPVGC